MFSNQEFLQVVDRLRGEWTALVGDENVAALAKWMDETQLDDPESVQQTTGCILDLLKTHPEAQKRIASELGIKGALPLRLTGYDPLAGADNEVPAGTTVVCPIDPTHCRKKLRAKGQKLFCPQHGKLLVPEDQLESKE